MVTDSQLVIPTDFPRRLVTVQPVEHACISHRAAELCGLRVMGWMYPRALLVLTSPVTRGFRRRLKTARGMRGCHSGLLCGTCTKLTNGTVLFTRGPLLATDWLSLADCRLHLLRLCALAT